MTHPDPLWMKSLLMVHIAAGFSAFLLAPVALATAKGGKQHKRWGMVYLWAMGVVAATAVPMALYRPVLFLALVAIFSFYAAFSGYRVLRLKDLARGGSAGPIDWLAGLFTFGASACLSLFGIFKPAWVQNMGVVAIVFGIIGMRLASVQLISFVRKPKEKMFWWYTHLGNFIGSYIAAWTAFLVTNVHPGGALRDTFNSSLEKMIWLLPTAIGVPAIVLTVAYYRRKFAPKKKVATAAA
jgi:steroid 5-alpha reductase family enzyme